MQRDKIVPRGTILYDKNLKEKACAPAQRCYKGLRKGDTTLQPTKQRTKIERYKKMLTSNDLKALLELEKLGEEGARITLESVPYWIDKTGLGYLAIRTDATPLVRHFIYAASMEEMRKALTKISLGK